MKKLSTLAYLSFAIGFCTYATAQTTTALTPTADTYTQQGTPDTNYGSQTTLLIRKDAADTLTRGAYLQFDLSSLPAGTITSATLRLYGSQDTGGTGGVSIKAIAGTAAGTWGETALTYNNSLTLTGADFTGTPIATTAISPPPSTTYSWNVTSFITSRRALGNATIGLAYTAPNTYRATFNSRQATTNRPQLVVVTTPPPNWSMFGKDYNNTRTSTDTTISAANVANLRVLRRVTQNRDGSPAGGVTGTPAVVDGIAYYSDFLGYVRAVNAVTGALVWQVRPQTSALSPSPAVTSDTVYVAGDYAIMYALNRATGELRWSRQLDPALYGRISSSPIVVDNKVILGVGSMQVFMPVSTPAQIFRGNIVALDTVSGNVLWRTPVCPADRCGSGISVWSTAAVDRESGTIFMGTGQAYSAPAGPYSDSLMAINIQDGSIRWHYQFTPNDVYTISIGTLDYDVGAAANLFEVNGVKMVGVGDKGGRYMAFNRATGARIWSTPVGRPGAIGGVMASTAYVNGVIYVTSNTSIQCTGTCRGNSRPMTGIAYALNAADGRILWNTALPSGGFGALLVANNLMYVMAWNGQLSVLNTANGVILKNVVAGNVVGTWDEAAQGFPNGSASGPSIYNGRLYVGYGWTWGFSGNGGMSIIGL